MTHDPEDMNQDRLLKSIYKKSYEMRACSVKTQLLSSTLRMKFTILTLTKTSVMQTISD